MTTDDTLPKTKVCSRCGKRKRRHLMVSNSTTRDGLGSWCKACMKEYTQERRAKKDVREKDREWNRTYGQALRVLRKRYPDEFEEILEEVREREAV